MTEFEQHSEPSTGGSAMENKWTFFGQVYGFKAFLLILLATVIDCFSSTSFGLSWTSLRVVVSMWLVFLFLNYVGAIVRLVFAKRKKRGYAPRLAARPVFLVFLILSVLFARVTGAQPALVFGAVLALEYTSDASKFQTRLAARGTAAGALWAVSVGLVAWGLYSFISLVPSSLIMGLAQAAPANSAAGQGVNFAAILALALVTFGQMLSMLTIASLASLPVVLLPFSFLEGGHLWRHNKWLWAIIYLVACSAYTVALVSLPSSWNTITVSFGLWVATYVSYFVLAVAIWAYFRLTKDRTQTVQP
ncbi:MAG: hypothetical protein RLZZ626_356 [Actinomycetota bacterium]